MKIWIHGYINKRRRGCAILLRYFISSLTSSQLYKLVNKKLHIFFLSPFIPNSSLIVILGRIGREENVNLVLNVYRYCYSFQIQRRRCTHKSNKTFLNDIERYIS